MYVYVGACCQNASGAIFSAYNNNYSATMPSNSGVVLYMPVMGLLDGAYLYI